LSFNNFSRENSVPNRYQSSGREKQDELGLNWIDFGARMYMPDIGRWNSIDDVADMFYDESPYSYAANNPVNVIDVGGYFRISAEFAYKYPTLTKMIAHYLPLLKGNQGVKKAWMEVTNGTSAQFDEMVTYGSGPEIIPTDPSKASIYNQRDPCASDDSQFSPKHPDKLFIAPDALQELEEEMKKAINGQENQMGPQMFYVSLKIMHEAAHYGVFKHKGEKAFWSLESNPRFGDQGAAWEDRAYERFSYKSEASPSMNKDEVFNYYHKNYSDDTMRGMTLNPQMFYNYIMLMGPTPGTSESKRKKQSDADREARRRSTGQ
jgi:RHS repeat-associated protein